MKKSHLKKLLVLLAFTYASMAFAQQTVTGTVSAFDGPLPGVNIIEKGTTNGVTTDFDGNFTITVGDNATLVFSYIGFKTQELVVAGQSLVLGHKLK